MFCTVPKVVHRIRPLKESEEGLEREDIREVPLYWQRTIPRGKSPQVHCRPNDGDLKFGKFEALPFPPRV